MFTNYLSAIIYTLLSLLAAAAFLLATVFTGDYTWVTRLGGAGWVFLLTMIITMPTLMPLVKSWQTRQSAREAEEEGKMWPFKKKTVKDVVCGMEIEPGKAAATSIYEGATYYFCAVSCKEAFDREPSTYISKVG